MNFQEKTLYHQVHPLKLLADWGSTPPALRLFWQHRLGAALFVEFLPAILSSLLLVQFADLEGIKKSATGRYLARYMTPEMQALRLAGNGVLIAGAWWRQPALFPLGVGIILFGWFRGRLFPAQGAPLRAAR